MRFFRVIERYYKAWLVLLALLLFGGYAHQFLVGSERKDRLELGYYAYESWEKGRMRWTGKKTYMRIRPETDLFGFSIAAHPCNSQEPGGLVFNLFLNGKILDVTHFFNGGDCHLYYYIPGIKGRYIEIGTEVNKTFNPYRLGINKDRRELGVAMSPFVFLEIMPLDGIGFYEREKTKNVIGGWPEGEKKQFRWTKKRASINVSKHWPWITGEQAGWDKQKKNKGSANGSICIFLKCTHPDIERKPVKIKILGDSPVSGNSVKPGFRFLGDELLREVDLHDHSWKKLEFRPDELIDQKVISFEVSRTWNPKQMKMSNDERDLGVAVAIP